MAKQSIMEQIRALDEQRSSLIEGAKSELLGNIKEAIRDLKALGFDYRVVEGDDNNQSDRKGTRRVKDEPCPICGFKTIPRHDRRGHRTQTDKKPFTAAELKERGYERI